VTTTRTWPDHLLTLAEWDALGQDTSRRIELVEGVLLVSPRPVARHQLVVLAIAAALDTQLRPAWRALPEVEVTVEETAPPTVRTPDVSVVRAHATDGRARQSPSDVLAVVEVLSPGSRRTDRILKLSEYAEAGIGCYLLVEPGPPVSMVEFELVERRYERAGEHRGHSTLSLLPDVTLDLDAL